MTETIEMRREWLLHILLNVMDSKDSERMESAIAALVFNLPDSADMLDNLADSVSIAVRTI